MRNLIKKSLAFVLVAALALTCFVGTFSVSAEDATSYNANISVTANPVTLGDDEATAVINIDMVEENAGINEALINISSEIGAIKDVKLTASDVAGEIDYGTGEDVVPADCKGFYLSANSEKVDGESVMGSIASATITVTFAVADTVKEAGSYAITIDIPESKVIAATKDEVAVNFIYDNSVSFVVKDTKCEHVNATKTLSSVTETEFVYTLDCPDCDEENLTDEVAVGAPLASPITISKTIEPRNDVSILLEIPTKSVASYSNLTVVVSKEEYASESTEAKYASYYLTDSWASTVYGGYTEFKFSNINAYEMNSAISFVLYGMDSNGDMIKLGTLNYSVAEYVVNQVKKKISGTVTAALKTTLVDMLIYGSKVQIYGKFNVNNLAVDRLNGIVETGTNKNVMEYATPESEWATTSADVPSLSDTTTHNLDNTTPAGTLGLSRSLLLSNKVNTLFVITKRGTADMNDLYIKYDYYDVQGNLATPMVAKYEGSIFQGAYPQFVFDAAPVSVYDYPVKATVYYGDPNNGGIAIAYTNYSVATYISKYIATGTVEFQNALKSLNAYAKSLAILANVTPYAE